ncbi:MAG: hypothetical protein CVU16_10060 [Betaproteobacteria bacterium HGW-Betaproteobacteria-10]|nr:MAG: hypothetical protein CVU16_10060 [Betaproteobacteria bacterium HGW-Betaproteobacteria-10]
MIYATFLYKNSRSGEALKQADEAVAESHGEGSANLYYNIGLVYLDLKQYDKALSNAHLAYQMGFPLPGLRDRLKRAGKWSEPLPPVTESPVETSQLNEGKAPAPATSPVVE